MVQLDAIRRKAKDDLIIQTPEGTQDVFLWEHAQRIAVLSEMICNLLGPRGGRVDREVLVAAALYHSVGWAVQYRQGAVLRSDILSRPLSDLQREHSAVCAEESLRPYASNRRLQALCAIIRESGRRKTTHVAAKVLSDACNLDGVGPLSLWLFIRKHNEEGLGISSALKTWDRQREYNFWRARIEDSFNFEPVKEIAYLRLETLNRFMASLSEHVEAADVQSRLSVISSESVLSQSPSQ